MEQSICCAEMRWSKAVERSSWGIREVFTRGTNLQPDLKAVGNGEMEGRQGEDSQLEFTESPNAQRQCHNR